jgi:hypothetical protein
MRTSLLPKVPTRALALKMKSATQSVVLNPMRFVAHARVILRSETFRSYVHFMPESGHQSDIAPCPLCAKSGHQLAYSITSSAIDSNPDGTSMLSARALPPKSVMNSRRCKSAPMFNPRDRTGSIQYSIGVQSALGV